MNPSQEPPRLVLVLGGARSGKSTFAEQLATSSGRATAYIATATAHDDEMRARIARHKLARPAHWQTIEEPLDLAGALGRAFEHADTVLLDCVTLWLSNWLTRPAIGDLDENDARQQETTRAILNAIERLLAVNRAAPQGKTLIVVSNEVGLGIVPEYALGRVYRDTLGWVNQRLATEAERVYLLVAGLPVDIKRLAAEATLHSESDGSC